MKSEESEMAKSKKPSRNSVLECHSSTHAASSTSQILLSRIHNACKCNRPTRYQAKKFEHLLHLPRGLGCPLNLVSEVEVSLVELMYTNVAIFAAACVALALGVNCYGVCGVSITGRHGQGEGEITEGAEMASNTTDFLFKDLVVESSFELSLPGWF